MPGMGRGQDVLNKQNQSCKHMPSAFRMNHRSTDSMSNTMFLQQTALAIAFIQAMRVGQWCDSTTPPLLHLWQTARCAEQDPSLSALLAHQPTQCGMTRCCVPDQHATAKRTQLKDMQPHNSEDTFLAEGPGT